MTVRIAMLTVGVALLAGSPAASARSEEATQYGTTQEYHWLREKLSDPQWRSKTIAKCQEYVADAPHMDVLAKRTGIAEEELRRTFCERYYNGLASGQISLKEFLHQDKPTENYIRILQGR